VTKTTLLARTFFTRFFESELLPPGLPQVQLVIWSLAILAAPGLLLPIRFGSAYSMMQAQPELLARMMLMHRLAFITISMTAMGFVALVLWENVFPDRRDARQLGVLPLSGRVLIVARLIALTALAGVFLAGVNAIPTVTYGPFVGFYGGARNPVFGMVAHLVATSGAGLFAFFTLLALQGIWLNVGGRRWADRFAIVLQVLFVVGLLLNLLLLPRLAVAIGTDLSQVAADPALRNVPSFWFLALYDVLGGRPSPGSGPLAAVGVSATLGVVAIAAAMLVATHGRLMRRALEGQEPPRQGTRLVRAIVEPIVALVCRGSIARAVFGFTLRTLVRSRSHRLLLALYLGVASAVLIVIVSPVLVRHGLAGLTTPRVQLLAVPFVLMFFSLCGFKLLIGIPVEPKANWVFRQLEPPNRMAAVNGVRSAMLVAGVAPAAAIATASAAVLWGAWPAFVHGTMSVAMGWLLTELLLSRLRKIPFTCTYFPGRSRLQLWPLYLLAFSNYSFTTAGIERALLDRPVAFAWLVAVLVATIGLLTVMRARALKSPVGLRFEEEDPDALFEGFRLSEGLAARASRSGSPGI
jgi:hypothetical protein